jgi:hypothetical protein
MIASFDYNDGYTYAISLYVKFYFFSQSVYLLLCDGQEEEPMINAMEGDHGRKEIIYQGI